MNILFTRFPLESANGGAENQTMWLAQGLKEKGHVVSFLGSCPVLSKRFSDAGFSSTQLNIGEPPVTKWGVISFFWRKKKMQRLLIERLEEFRIQNSEFCILMLSLSEKLLLTLWCKQQGIPVFWIEHDRIGSWLSKNPWLGALKKASQFATIICVSELSRKMYLDLGFSADRVIAIPNGIPVPDMRHEMRDMSRMASSRLTSHISELQIGCVSRLSREKGVDVLIQSIATLPEVTLKIVGKGPDEGYVRTLIAEDTKRIGDERIHLQSNVENLSAFYESLDAFVLPSSDHDPFGLVAAEAMARGIPTIITSACGIASSLQPGEALIADAGSTESLNQNIQQMFDPTRRAALAEAGLNAVTSRLTLEQMVKSYEKLLSR
jgi:glycosyltransferase involved in cell wall biosynthesis